MYPPLGPNGTHHMGQAGRVVQWLLCWALELCPYLPAV